MVKIVSVWMCRPILSVRPTELKSLFVVAFLQNATIEYSSESVCVCFHVCVCVHMRARVCVYVCLHDISKEIDLET